MLGSGCPKQKGTEGLSRIWPVSAECDLIPSVPLARLAQASCRVRPGTKGAAHGVALLRRRAATRASWAESCAQPGLS